MTTEEDIKYDRNLVGVEHTIGPFIITREMILEFSAATGEVNPLYTDEVKAKASKYGGLIAPPTFCHIFITSINRPDIKLDFGDTGLFAGQTIENMSPIRPGDILNATVKLKEVYTKRGRSGKMVFAVWETSFTNQEGEAVVRVRESFVRKKSRKQ
jgi:acyl dehydratase